VLVNVFARGGIFLSWHCGISLSWHCGIFLSWHCGIFLSWHCGIFLSWHCGIFLSWHCGIFILWSCVYVSLLGVCGCSFVAIVCGDTWVGDCLVKGFVSLVRAVFR
jgi:hypothetical protein